MIKRNLQISLAFLFFLAVLFTSSCKKNIPGIIPPNQYSDTDFNQVFQAYWTGMNNNYVFWSIDTTNWDNMYLKYQPLFAQLKITDSQDVIKAYGYFQQMTQGLVDGHYNISFYNPILANMPEINPSSARKKNIAPGYTFGYFVDTVAKKYMDSYYWADTAFPTTFAGKSYTSYMGIVTGIIDGHIVYLHLNQFALENLVGQGYSSVTKVWNQFLSNLQDASVAGVIIDVRSNPGGYIEDLDFICGEMMNKPLHFAYTREKSGNGRLDYTPWADAIVTPVAGSTAITVPIVVLTDQHSVSMAEITTMALKTLPNTYVIGDTTWGANGPLDTDVGLYGGGQFTFANFGYVYTSSAMYKYGNGVIYEGKGFPPDKYVPYSQSSRAAGKDPALEAAISYINP